MGDVTLRGERLSLRPAREDDLETLTNILGAPEVARWWGTFDPARLRAELLGPGRFVILVDGAVRGWLAAEEEADPDYRQVGLDLFLAAGFHGRGYGPEALRVAIDHFAARGHHRFTIDPAVANRRAIRAYEKVGFRAVGVMRAYERGPDGTWHDNLLMEALAAELDG
jgi:aminoglycoside 6'-N-acetyltransferase